MCKSTLYKALGISIIGLVLYRLLVKRLPYAINTEVPWVLLGVIFSLLIWSIIEIWQIKKQLKRVTKVSRITELIQRVIKTLYYKPLKEISVILLEYTIILYILGVVGSILRRLVKGNKTLVILVIYFTLIPRLLMGIALVFDVFLLHQIITFYKVISLVALTLLFYASTAMLQDYLLIEKAKMEKQYLIVTYSSIETAVTEKRGPGIDQAPSCDESEPQPLASNTKILPTRRSQESHSCFVANAEEAYDAAKVRETDKADDNNDARSQIVRDTSQADNPSKVEWGYSNGTPYEALISDTTRNSYKRNESDKRITQKPDYDKDANGEYDYEKTKQSRNKKRHKWNPASDAYGDPVSKPTTAAHENYGNPYSATEDSYSYKVNKLTKGKHVNTASAPVRDTYGYFVANGKVVNKPTYVNNAYNAVDVDEGQRSLVDLDYEQAKLGSDYSERRGPGQYQAPSTITVLKDKALVAQMMPSTEFSVNLSSKESNVNVTPSVTSLNMEASAITQDLATTTLASLVPLEISPKVDTTFSSVQPAMISNEQEYTGKSNETRSDIISECTGPVLEGRPQVSNVSFNYYSSLWVTGYYTLDILEAFTLAKMLPIYLYTRLLIASLFTLSWSHYIYQVMLCKFTMISHPIIYYILKLIWLPTII